MKTFNRSNNHKEAQAASAIMESTSIMTKLIN